MRDLVADYLGSSGMGMGRSLNNLLKPATVAAAERLFPFLLGRSFKLDTFGYLLCLYVC